MSREDLRGVLSSRPQRVPNGDCEVKAGRDAKERSNLTSSVNHRSELGNGQPSKSRVNNLGPTNDHFHLAKRARLDREPGELGSSTDTDSEVISLSDASSDCGDVNAIIDQDFEMEIIIRNFKLSNLPKPVPLLKKSYTSETSLNGKNNCDKKSPDLLPVLASNVLPTKDISKAENASHQNAPVLIETERSQKPIFCSKCATNFDPEAFPDHEINVHLFPDSLKGPSSCPDCHELFTNRSALLRHYKISHFVANQNRQEIITKDREIMYDKSPPPLEVDSQSPAEETEEEHTSLTNGVASNPLEVSKEDNSHTSKLKAPLTNKSQEESPSSNVPDKTDTSTKEAAVPKVPISNKPAYASLPLIPLPPQQPPPPVPPVRSIPVSKPSSLFNRYQAKQNAIRDPRIARINALPDSTSTRILMTKDNKNGLPQGHLPDSMKVPIKQPPLMKTARQRVADKWREPEIIQQQSEEIEKLKALLQTNEEKFKRSIREKKRTIEKTEKKLKTVKNSLKEKTQEMEDLGKKMQSAESEKIDLNKIQLELQTKHIGAQCQLSESIRVRDALEGKVSSLEKQLAQSEQKYLKIVGQMKKERSDKTTTIKSLGDKVNILTERVQLLESFENQVSRLSEELESTTAQLKKYKEIEENHDAEIEQSNKTISDLYNELWDSRLRTQAAESELESLETQIKLKEGQWVKYSQDLKTQIRELIGHNKEKDEALAVFKNQSSVTSDRAILMENNTHYKSLIACMEKKMSAMGRKILKLKKDN